MNESDGPRYVVSIAPQMYDGDRLTISDSLRAIRESQTRIKGWAMPFDLEGLTSGGDHIAGQTNWSGIVHHVEAWRLYRSGNFVFRCVPFELLEPDFEERAREIAARNFAGGGRRRTTDGIVGFLSFVALIYFVTQVYVFAGRLAQAVPYDGVVDIDVGLRDVANYALGSNELATRLYEPYMTAQPDPRHRASLPIDQLVANPAEAAVPALLGIVEQFGWFHATPTILHHQRSFLS